jgi:hypothetical protein
LLIGKICRAGEIGRYIFFTGGTPSRSWIVAGKWRLIKYLDGKTVAGTSAGGDAIAKYYSVLKTSRVGDGLGLLPIKFIPHWKSNYSDDEVRDIDWEAELNKLREYKEDLPIYTLAEGEFKVFNR